MIMIKLICIATSSELSQANTAFVPMHDSEAQPTYWEMGELYKLKATNLILEPHPQEVCGEQPISEA